MPKRLSTKRNIKKKERLHKLKKKISLKKLTIFGEVNAINKKFDEINELFERMWNANAVPSKQEIAFLNSKIRLVKQQLTPLFIKSLSAEKLLGRVKMDELRHHLKNEQEFLKINCKALKNKYGNSGLESLKS